MLRAVWNNPAGGLRYHVRAWRQRGAWQAYRRGLVDWLSLWRPGCKSLALVGPSAGHCLPYAALTPFERFVVFEIDPLARMLLKRRLHAALPDRDVVWVAEDLWLGPIRREGRLSPELIRALEAPEPSCVLFCNFIGQVAYMLEPGEYPDFRTAWVRDLFPRLQQTPWASFHDRVSGEAPPYEELPSNGQRLSDAQLSALYETDPSRELIELNDHGSQELLPEGYDYRYLHWPLTRSMHHLIECVLGGPAAGVRTADRR